MITDKQLAQLQIFKDVNLDSIRDLINECPVVSFEKGATLLNPEQQNNRMFVILDGQVSIRLNNPQSTPISIVYKGESIGEMSVHDGKDPSAIVRAETDTTLIELDSDALFNLIEQSHTVARNLLYLTSDRLRRGNQKMESTLNFQKKTIIPE